MKLQAVSTFTVLLLAGQGTLALGQSDQDPIANQPQSGVRGGPDAEPATPEAALSGSMGAVRARLIAKYPIELIEPNSAPTLLEQARALTRTEVLAKFDRNIDGKLDPEEASNARRDSARRESIKADLVRRFDDNKNGRLDAAEMSRARADFAATRKSQVLLQFDSNKNGVLDPAERVKLQRVRQQERALWSLRCRFDRNQDQRLDLAEAMALEQFIAVQKVRGEDPLSGLTDPRGSSGACGAMPVGDRARAQEAGVPKSPKPGTRSSAESSPAEAPTKKVKPSGRLKKTPEESQG